MRWTGAFGGLPANSVPATTERNTTPRVAFYRCRVTNGAIPMKALLTVVALSVATVAFAQTQTPPNPPTQSECEKMSDKRWDPNSKSCLPK